MKERRLKIFIAAGEVSGDRQAAHLAKAILRQDPTVMLFGSGGEKMREAGIDIRLQTSHLGTVGFQEYFKYIRPLRAIMEKIRSLLRSERPDIAVLVDNEGFNGLLAKFLYKEGIPFIYYFPPQVWFWGEWRARGISKKARALITAFPQEATIYSREGGNVYWYGHPLIDIVKVEEDYSLIAQQAGINPAQKTIGLLPGSRFQEIQQLLPPMLEAARLIRERQDFQILLPVAARHLLPEIRSELVRTRMDKQVTVISEHVYTLLSRCELVIISSGTATLEAALLGVPMVVAYRVKPFTYFLGRRLLRARYITMPNILLDREAVPELLQENVTGERLAFEALVILDDRERAKKIRKDLASVREILGEPGVLQRAARLVLEEAAGRVLQTDAA